MKINTLPFSKVLTDSTKKFTKIKKQDYLDNGKYKIVDQGKDFICGYTNNTQLVNFDDSPVVIFGDHTKVFKFIDFPLAIGADGVKVLTVDSNIADTKYVYYYFKSLHLHDAGYSRHFKYLKVKKIPFPENLDEQIKIVNLLTQVESLIVKEEESIELLDELLRSSFQDMFGEFKTFKQVLFEDTIEYLTDYHANGSYKVLKSNVELLDNKDYALMIRTTDLENNNFEDNVKYITKNAYKFLKKTKIYGGEIIMNKIGSAGNVYLMPYLNIPVSLGMNQFTIKINNNYNNIFVYYLLKSSYGKSKIDQRIKGAVTKSITKDAVRSIPIIQPPKPLQDEFAAIVKQVEVSKEKYQKSLDKLHELFGSLSQRAFRGELDLSTMDIVEQLTEDDKGDRQNKGNLEKAFSSKEIA